MEGHVNGFSAVTLPAYVLNLCKIHEKQLDCSIEYLILINYIYVWRRTGIFRYSNQEEQEQDLKIKLQTCTTADTDHPTLLPMMARTSSSGDVGVPEMSGLLLLRLRERFRLRLAGRTAERAMVA